MHAFGQTCKLFHQLAGKYFQWKYKRVLGHVYFDSITIDWKDLDGFKEFVQRVLFYDSEPDLSLLYALENCKSAKEMEIVNANYSLVIDTKPFESMLIQLEKLAVNNIHFSNELFESFMKLCVNLKHLTVSVSPGNGWMRHKYPKLEHVHLQRCEPCEDKDLRAFFSINTTVKSFTTNGITLLRNHDAFMASNIHFDDLKITRYNDIDTIAIALHDLYQRGFYKRLHFVATTERHLADLPNLVTLYVDTYDYIRMPLLATVTELVFQALWNGLCSFMDMDEVSMALTNLERVYSSEISLKYMLPFICNSTKLKEIKMNYFRDDCGYIDPVHMDNERKKLKYARKVIIYVEEKDYLKIKWKYSKSDFGLIEIKRKESYEGVWEPVFRSR